MGATINDELYHSDLIGMLEAVWGDGFLSPGGADEVAEVLRGITLEGRSVLDIGCGVGGVDVLLVERFGAGYVTGVDVEDTVLNAARERVIERGLADRIGFAKVSPGPVPFPAESFGIVFSKDSIVHVPDKGSLARDVFRVLEPGGWFVASDWLIGHDRDPSQEMAVYIEAEGLDFGMASPAVYLDALSTAGFSEIGLRSRHEWYRQVADRELEQMRGPLYEPAVARFGREFVDHNIDIWAKMLPVLETGEHQPTHLRARRPI